MVERDSTMPPPMTINDIIALSQDSVSADVIISQMKATDSYFRLSTDDIVALRKAGVNDNVINAMIETANHPPQQHEREVYPAYYPYSWYSWYPYYWYPWYYPFYYGGSYRVGFHGGYHYYGGSHYGAAHYGGGVRTTRTHR